MGRGEWWWDGVGSWRWWRRRWWCLRRLSQVPSVRRRPSFVAVMDLLVARELVGPRKAAVAAVLRACERALSRMCADVRSEVVRARKVARTDRAPERLVACVLADVPCELVGAREALQGHRGKSIKMSKHAG